MSLLNLIETFLGEWGTVGKAVIGRVGNTTRKEGENPIGTIRKRFATELFVTIINMVEPRVVGQRTTGVAATAAAEAMAARTVNRILVMMLSTSSRW